MKIRLYSGLLRVMRTHRFLKLYAKLSAHILESLTGTGEVADSFV